MVSKPTFSEHRWFLKHWFTCSSTIWCDWWPQKVLLKIHQKWQEI